MAKKGGKISPATEWKKGQSGNLNGRPKGTLNSATRLKRFLELYQEKTNPVTGEKELFTVAEQMDMALIAKALKGDIRAYQEIFDRFEGKPKQVIESQGEQPLTIKIVRTDGDNPQS